MSVERPGDEDEGCGTTLLMSFTRGGRYAKKGLVLSGPGGPSRRVCGDRIAMYKVGRGHTVSMRRGD
jgi:hypothetical protein